VAEGRTLRTGNEAPATARRSPPPIRDASTAVRPPGPALARLETGQARCSLIEREDAARRRHGRVCAPPVAAPGTGRRTSDDCWLRPPTSAAIGGPLRKGACAEVAPGTGIVPGQKRAGSFAGRGPSTQPAFVAGDALAELIATPPPLSVAGSQHACVASCPLSVELVDAACPSF